MMLFYILSNAWIILCFIIVLKYLNVSYRLFNISLPHKVVPSGACWHKNQHVFNKFNIFYGALMTCKPQKIVVLLRIYGTVSLNRGFELIIN